MIINNYLKCTDCICRVYYEENHKPATGEGNSKTWSVESKYHLILPGGDVRMYH